MKHWCDLLRLKRGIKLNLGFYRKVETDSGSCFFRRKGREATGVSLHQNYLFPFVPSAVDSVTRIVHSVESVHSI